MILLRVKRGDVLSSVINRARIKEVGDRPSPFAFTELCDQLTDTFYARATPEAIGGASEVFFVLENEYLQKAGGLPKELAEDQVEDYLLGRVVRGALFARKAQNESDRLFGGSE